MWLEVRARLRLCPIHFMSPLSPITRAKNRPELVCMPSSNKRFKPPTTCSIKDCSERLTPFSLWYSSTGKEKSRSRLACDKVRTRSGHKTDIIDRRFPQSPFIPPKLQGNNSVDVRGPGSIMKFIVGVILQPQPPEHSNIFDSG